MGLRGTKQVPGEVSVPAALHSRGTRPQPQQRNRGLCCACPKRLPPAAGHRDQRHLGSPQYRHLSVFIHKKDE